MISKAVLQNIKMSEKWEKYESHPVIGVLISRVNQNKVRLSVLSNPSNSSDRAYRNSIEGREERKTLPKNIQDLELEIHAAIHEHEKDEKSDKIKKTQWTIQNAIAGISALIALAALAHTILSNRNFEKRILALEKKVSATEEALPTLHPSTTPSPSLSLPPPPPETAP